MGNAKRDDNSIPTLIAVSNVDGSTPITLYADPTTHRLLVSATAGALDDLTDVVITSAAQGDIFYNNGTDWVNLPAGTAGQFLETRGVANPRWGTPTAGAGGSTTQLQYNNAGSLAGITGATSNGTIVTLNSAALGSPTITGSPTAAGSTWANLGTVTTVAINAGAINATTLKVGGANAYYVGGTDVALADGGTNASLVASNGGIVYSDASGMAILTATATAGQIIRSGASAAPTWSTSTYPATNAVNTLLVATGTNVMGALATGNNGVLITSATGTPSISSTIPSATQDNITRLGTVTTGNVDAIVSSASLTASGKIEIATAAETTTGTDATRAVSPDGLAGSDYGKRIIEVQLLSDSTNNAITGQVASASVTIPSEMNGWNIISVNASVASPGVTTAQQIQVRNLTSGQNVLSTPVYIDSAEYTSYTAATPSVVGSPALATGDRLVFNVTAIHTTPAKGLNVILVAQAP